MARQKRLRVGVIGLGVGERHAAAFERNTSCTVAALCDTSESKLKSVGRKYPKAELTRRFEKICRDPSIDVVSIASFDEAHFEQVMEALERGKHVFVEKPLCRSLKEAAQIKTAWLKHRGKIKLASNLILRKAPLFVWLKRKFNEGYFGDVYAFDADYLYGRFEKMLYGWRKDTPDYSVMQGGGIHVIDLMLWLTGQRPTHVFALGNRLCGRGTSFRYNDYAAMSLRFASTLVGRVTANFGCIHRHHHAMRIFGTKKTLLYDDSGVRVHSTTDPKKKAMPIDVAILAGDKGDLIPDFVRSITHASSTRDNTQLFFDGVAIATTCDRSIQTKKEELIRYI